MFGGEATLLNGQKVSLVSALKEALKPKPIKRAGENCGHCPATWKALKSNRVRHGIVENKVATSTLKQIHSVNFSCLSRRTTNLLLMN